GHAGGRAVLPDGIDAGLGAVPDVHRDALLAGVARGRLANLFPAQAAARCIGVAGPVAGAVDLQDQAPHVVVLRGLDARRSGGSGREVDLGDQALVRDPVGLGLAKRIGDAGLVGAVGDGAGMYAIFVPRFLDSAVGVVAVAGLAD